MEKVVAIVAVAVGFGLFIFMGLRDIKRADEQACREIDEAIKQLIQRSDHDKQT